MRRIVIALLVICVSSMGAFAEASAASSIRWESWSSEAFARAQRENKLVILDLEAVWCHWCHVMDKETYSDPQVVKLVQDGFVALRVDQDSRPDLANRYEDYGWPATIIYNSKGDEIVKMSGYIPPRRMRSLLAACIADPTPGPSVTGAPTEDLSASPRDGLADRLRAHLDGRYDRVLGGWSDVHKYLEWDATEYCLRRAADGDAAAASMARKTMDAQLGLIDPVWGGVYQYSDGGVWENPHFEKIMAMQAENMRIYAQAWSQWREPRYRAAAEAIHHYLHGFLQSSDRGPFYVSQDADLVEGEHSAEYFALGDAARRARGIPRVDKHVYARENGWAIQGLCALYAATGDSSARAEAEGAAAWILAHRFLPGGGFRHDERDAAGPYLGDTLAMGRAFLGLYGVTGDRAWLARAQASADFIAARFARAGTDGYATAVVEPGMPATSQVDENIALARFANLLWHYSGKQIYRDMAERAREYLTQPALALRNDAGLLLTLDELDTPPLHVTVVGARSDARAAALFAAALQCPSGYRRVEWFDASEGALPNNDVEFPHNVVPAAYICTGTSCSRPIVDAAVLTARWTKARP